MSSKSRKKSSPKKPRGSQAGTPAAAAGAEEHHTVAELTDEYIHTPTERSRLYFVFMIGLLIVLLVIFVVPSALLGGSGGSAEDPVWVRYEDPVDGAVEITNSEFLQFKRELSTALEFDPLLRVIVPTSGTSLSDEDTAGAFVLDRLARNSGIVVSDSDLTEHLRSLIDLIWQGDVQRFRSAENSRGGPKAVEGAIRRFLGVARYAQFFGHLGGLGTPDDVEEFWAEEHVEYAYDYLRASVVDFAEETEAAVPDDTGLQTWFEELPSARRDGFRQPERRAAQMVVLTDFEAAAASGLTETFPAAEDIDRDEEARNYYDRVFFRRFKRPEKPEPPVEEVEEPVAEDEPEVSEETEDPGDEGVEEVAAEDETEPEDETPTTPYLTFEEAKEGALLEAPVYFAFERWLNDLRERQQAGEDVDFATEAAGFGLVLETYEPLSQRDYNAREEVGPSLGILVYQTNENEFSPRVQVEEDSLVLVRVLEILEPALPEFDEMRDELVEAWKTDNQRELAMESLRSLRDGFAVLEVEEDEADTDDPEADEADEEEVTLRRQATEEAFAAAAGTVSLEVLVRPYLDKAGKLEDDPDRNEEDHVFFRTQREWYDLEVNEVPEPVLDARGLYAYLPRLSGSRPVPIEKMAPADYDRYRRRSANEAQVKAQEAFQLEALRERYKVWIWLDDEEAAEEDAAAPAES